MPVHKRPRGTVTPPPSPPPPHEVEDDADGSAENDDGEQPDDASDSDGSSYSSGGEEDEFIVVKLGEIRKEVQCPICLGVIRKTRTVMECLHRFCRECIDKSMRLGNNECPACRTHCASRRSLRDDPNYDALIAALYPDIDKFEEEELAFLEEEKARNKQIQASIAQTFRRQAEALGKKPRAVTPTSLRRQGNYRNLRARRNHRVVEHNDSDEEEEVNGHDNSSSSDEHSAEVKSKRYRKWGRTRSSQPSSGANASGGCDDNNDPEGTMDLVGTSSAGPISSTDFLGWGRGGLRSNLRHGGANLANSRLSRNNRLSKLINYLQSSNENDELKINLMIVSLHEDKIPCLKRPHLCCSPTTSVGQLCQYVAMQTSVGASEMEMLIVNDSLPVKYSSSPPTEAANYNPSNHELQLLDEHQTLGQIHTQFYEQNLVFAYRLKGQGEGN